MVINIYSESCCRKAYLNYHCYGNTMGISDEEMGKITSAWSNKLESWQTTVSSDENEYDFSDVDYRRYQDDGKDAAQDATGYDGSPAGNIAAGAGHAVGAAAGAVVSNLGTKLVSKSLSNAIGEAAEEAVKVGTEKLTMEAAKTSAEKAAVKTAEKLGEEAAKKGGGQTAKVAANQVSQQVTKDAGKSIGCIIGCSVGFATAAAYWISQPNKEEKEACDKLQAEMTGAQSALGGAQSEMEFMSDEIISLSDEANTLNEDTNEEIEEQKTEYDMYLQTMLTIQQKIESGEPLTESEKELYKEVVGYLQEIGVLIEETADNTTDEVADLYDTIATYQEGYDNTAQTMGEVEGLTDYAASIDSTTQTMCYVEGAAQSLNAASSAKSAYEAFALGTSGSWFFGATAWAYVFGAMGAAGAVSSGIALGQQFTWAGEVGTEIEMRKATQDLNTDTMDIYTEEIDAYDGYMQGVEDLELEIPDEIAPPEETSVPVAQPPTEEEDAKLKKNY